jgi:hypothetical protein
MNNFNPKFRKSKNQTNYIRSNNIFWSKTPENEDSEDDYQVGDCILNNYFIENNSNKQDKYGSSYIQEYITIKLEDFNYNIELKSILDNISKDWKINLDYILINYNTSSNELEKKYFNIDNNMFINNLKSRINNYFNSVYNINVLLNKTSNLFSFIKFIFYSLKSTPEYFKENVINLLTLTCSCYNILCKKYIYNYQLNKIDETFKRKKIIHDVYYTDNCLNFIKDK